MSITKIRDKISLILEDETDVEVLVQTYLHLRQSGENNNVAIEIVVSGQRLDSQTLRTFYELILPYEKMTAAEIRASRQKVS